MERRRIDEPLEMKFSAYRETLPPGALLDQRYAVYRIGGSHYVVGYMDVYGDLESCSGFIPTLEDAIAKANKVAEKDIKANYIAAEAGIKKAHDALEEARVAMQEMADSDFDIDMDVELEDDREEPDFDVDMRVELGYYR